MKFLAFGSFELLANFVQRNLCLYDKKCKKYKDKKFVADTWNSIASAIFDMVQKQWKILRGQFTREHRLEKIYESASESSFNNLWNPNLFGDGLNVSSPLSERSMSSESLATSASSVSQPKSLAIARKDLLAPLPDHSEQLSKMIGNMTEAINMLTHSLTEKRSQPVSDDNEEEAAMAKTIIYVLKRVNFKYKIQCYIECLSILEISELDSSGNGSKFVYSWNTFFVQLFCYVN
ncbi:hypothetical protein ACFW04_012234 [Cataglyphis niger]